MKNDQLKSKALISLFIELLCKCHCMWSCPWEDAYPEIPVRVIHSWSPNPSKALQYPNERSQGSDQHLPFIPCIAQKPKGRLSEWGGNAITPLSKLIKISYVEITGQLLGKRAFNLNVKQNLLLMVLASVYWGETCHLLTFPFPGNESVCSALKLISTPLFSLSPQIDKKSVISTENEHPADMMICVR